MSMRMDYQRSAGFGATRGSIRAGERYERKVIAAVAALTINTPLPPGGATRNIKLQTQAPRSGGRVDIRLKGEGLHILIEVKSQWSLDAYNQLLHYAGTELNTVSRVCICKTFHPHVPIPERFKCLPLRDLLSAPPGSLIVIPWSPRR